MKPTTLHHYSALGISITIFLVSIFGYIFIYYSVNDQTASTAAAEKAVLTEQGTAARQKSIVDSLKATVDERAIIGSFVLTSDQTVPFIERVEGISKQSGATVSLVSISSDASLVHAHVNIQGSWTTMMRAMHLVENLPYSISMDSVRVSQVGKGLWNEDFDIAIPLSSSATNP